MGPEGSVKKRSEIRLSRPYFSRNSYNLPCISEEEKMTMLFWAGLYVDLLLKLVQKWGRLAGK